MPIDIFELLEKLNCEPSIIAKNNLVIEFLKTQENQVQTLAQIILSPKSHVTKLNASAITFIIKESGFPKPKLIEFCNTLYGDPFDEKSKLLLLSTCYSYDFLHPEKDFKIFQDLAKTFQNDENFTKLITKLSPKQQEQLKQERSASSQVQSFFPPQSESQYNQHDSAAHAAAALDNTDHTNLPQKRPKKPSAQKAQEQTEPPAKKPREF